MKKGQVYEGIIESVDFPNKGKVFLPPVLILDNAGDVLIRIFPMKSSLR